jgi:hypothetical protein
LSQDLTLSPEEYAKSSRELEQERQAIPQWTMALDRKDAELKEKLRPFALRLAVELPGRVAVAINQQEKTAGPDGVMAFWGIGQNFESARIALMRASCAKLSFASRDATQPLAIS